ncbi:MAG: triose-phosphate isomerase [Bacillota bacterium]
MKDKAKLFIGTNLKMYKNAGDTEEYLKKLEDLTRDIDRRDIELFVIPTFTSLERAANCVSRRYIKIGAQNMHWEEQGQYTGEVSPLMLKEIGVEIVEIGHSERRHVFGERDGDINRKVLSAIRHGFTALLCVGETLEQKEYGVSDEILGIQLKIGLNGLTAEDAKNLWIAYEPVWAIGVGGTPASADYAEEKHCVIKKILIDLFGEAGENVPVVYGGSVNLENSTEYLERRCVDGLFIGRSAWDAENFNRIIRKSLSCVFSK